MGCGLCDYKIDTRVVEYIVTCIVPQLTIMKEAAVGNEL